MEENKLTKSHKIVLTNRKGGNFTGVLDVISFDISEVLLETEQGMLNIKGKDLHVNRLCLDKGEVDISGHIDSVTYSDVPQNQKKGESFFVKLFK